MDPFKTEATDLTNARKTSYMKQIEKSNNPNIGPGSYDPIHAPKTNTLNKPIWSKAPERFKSIETKKND